MIMSGVRELGPVSISSTLSYPESSVLAKGDASDKSLLKPERLYKKNLSSPGTIARKERSINEGFLSAARVPPVLSTRCFQMRLPAAAEATSLCSLVAWAPIRRPTRRPQRRTHVISSSPGGDLRA